MSEISNNTHKPLQKIKHKNQHKYIFSKHNILNHDNSIESAETKLATNAKESNSKNFLTNSTFAKLKNKNKIKQKQEHSYMIVDSKKYKKNIHNNKKISKSLEKNKKNQIKKKENDSLNNHKYLSIISPLNNPNNFKYSDKNFHKRINSSGHENNNKGIKKAKYNNSFREFKRKVKMHNKSFELILDNNDENNEKNNYDKNQGLTSMNILDNNNETIIKNNIDNEEYLLTYPKEESFIDDDMINEEQIINMNKKKAKILEEIKLKKQELKLTELSLEILKYKYKKKAFDQSNPTSNNHTNNKIISNYNLSISLPINQGSKNITINNDSSNVNKKSFYAKTSLHKNNKEVINLKYSLANNRLNHSLKFRNKNNDKKNRSIQKGSSKHENRIFSFPKKKKNIINENNKDNKNNLSIKLISPEKNEKNENSINNSIDIVKNKNINIEIKKVNKINNLSNSIKPKINLNKKNIKREINLKPKNIKPKKNNYFYAENKFTNSNNNNNNKSIKNEIENEINKKAISRNNLEENEKSINNAIKINESDKENKSIKSINDSINENKNNISPNDNNSLNIKDNNSNDIKKENKSILILESICKKGFAGPGIKKTNQDNFFIYNNFNGNTNYIYMGICDGHGMFGQGVSTFLVNNLPQNLNTVLISRGIQNLSTTNINTLSETISSTFLFTNEQLSQDERIDSAFSGSTCVSLLFTPSRLICINVGDSRCVLGKFDGEKWVAKNLSRDHKPDIADEKERILKNGGRVEAYKDNEGKYVGPDRVWIQKGDLPGLAMSRSFGDEVAHLVGVITDPEILEYYLCKEDKFIILGSDGLWEFVNSQECVEIVKDFYLDKNVEGALTYLYKEASKRWILEEEIIDDITILIAFLKE